MHRQSYRLFHTRPVTFICFALIGLAMVGAAPASADAIAADGSPGFGVRLERISGEPMAPRVECERAVRDCSTGRASRQYCAMIRPRCPGYDFN